MQVIVRNLEKVTFSLNETKCDILNKTFWTYCLTVIFFLTSEERHILVCFTSLLYWPFLFPVRLFLTPLTLICIRFDSKYKHSRGRLRCRTPLVFKRKPLQREMGYRIRKRRELGESQAREETVESTLCRHSRYRSVVPPPYPTQSCSTAKCEGREREGGGAALSLRVQVVKAGAETHYCSCPQSHFARTKLAYLAYSAQWEREWRRQSETTDFLWLHFPPLLLLLLLFYFNRRYSVSSFQKRQLNNQPISAASQDLGGEHHLEEPDAALQEYKHPWISFAWIIIWKYFLPELASLLFHSLPTNLVTQWIITRPVYVSQYCSTFGDGLQYKSIARRSAPLRQEPPPQFTVSAPLQSVY